MADETTEEVGVRLVVNGQTLWSSSFTKATQDVEKFGAAARRQQAHIISTGKELDKSALAANNFGRDIKGAFGDAERAVGNFVSPLTTSLNTATNVAQRLAWPIAGITAGLTAAASAATYFGLKTYSGMEQANNAFSTFLGSTDKANDFMKQLKTFAMTTPFDFQNLVPAAQRMLNTGDSTTKALQDLTAIGDAAAGADPMEGQAGIDNIALAIGQIKMAPTLRSQEINLQLRNANIDAYKYLSEAKGVSKGQIIADMAASKIPGPEAAEVILQGMEKQYGGLMARQSKTLTGQLSNLHDSVAFELADASKPLAELLERNMPVITRELGSLAHLYGVVLNNTIEESQHLWNAFKSGGIEAVLGDLGRMTGTGSTFVTVWDHVRDDSEHVAHIWKDSFVPAIHDIEAALGPFAGVTLKTLEGTLRWMDDHPYAARKIFEELFVAFTMYKVTSLVLGLGMAFGGLIIKLDAAALAYGRLTGATELSTIAMAENDIAAMGGAGGNRGRQALRGLSSLGLVGLGVDQAYQGITSDKTSLGGYLQSAGGGAATGAGIGMWFGPWGAAGGAAVGGLAGAGGYLLNHWPGQASGGRTISPGMSWVGEKGPELLSMQQGATVVPLDDQGGSNRPPGTVVFEKGAIVIEAADYINGQALGDTLVGVITDRMARR